MATDLASTPKTGVRAQACGCHLLNFGGLATLWSIYFLLDAARTGPLTSRPATTALAIATPTNLTHAHDSLLH